MDPKAFERMRELEDHHWWFVARRAILHSILKRLPTSTDTKILEVGAGTGGNLAMLGAYGSVSAIEPDAAARSIAQQRSIADIEAGVLPNGLPFKDGFFDLVAALDVLEHVQEDEASLKAIGRKLRPGGQLLLTVPAYGWLWSEHDELHHHFRRYTKSEFSEVLISAGFKIQKISYFNAFLFPAIFFIRWMKKMLKITTRDDVMPAGWLNNILRAIFGSERWLLRWVNLPFGNSIVAIAYMPHD